MDALQQTRLATFLRLFQSSVPDLPDGGESHPATALRAGARVDARIVETLPDGRSLVDVEGTLYQARIPASVQTGPGGRLSLTVIDAGVPPTFGLAAQRDASALPSVKVDVGALAAQLRSIAQTAASQTGPVAPGEPVLPAPTTQGSALDAPLRTALETSGLFYESHQAEWVAGKRDLSALLAEPQARPLPGSGAVAPAEEGAASIAVTPGSASAATQAAAAVTSNDAGAPLSPAVATLVDRQLQFVGSNQIQWAGSLWPGQRMEWTVEEETAGGGREGEDETAWSSRLKLDLPRVGTIEAVLRLTGSAVRISLVVPPEQRQDIADALPELREALEARGLQLQGAEVGGRGG